MPAISETIIISNSFFSEKSQGSFDKKKKKKNKDMFAEILYKRVGILQPVTGDLLTGDTKRLENKWEGWKLKELYCI